MITTFSAKSSDIVNALEFSVYFKFVFFLDRLSYRGMDYTRTGLKTVSIVAKKLNSQFSLDKLLENLQFRNCYVTIRCSQKKCI